MADEEVGSQEEPSNEPASGDEGSIVTTPSMLGWKQAVLLVVVMMTLMAAASGVTMLLTRSTGGVAAEPEPESGPVSLSEDNKLGVYLASVDQRAITYAQHSARRNRGSLEPLHDPLAIVCAEPNPDAARARETSRKSEADTSASAAGAAAEGSVKNEDSHKETLHNLFDRSDPVQLLRDGMYRICEAYQNQAIDSREYYFLANKYANIMVTLLAIQRLTDGTYPVPEPHSAGTNETPAPADGETPQQTPGNEAGESDQAEPGPVAESPEVSETPRGLSIPDAVAAMVAQVTSQDRENRILQFCLDAIGEVNQKSTGKPSETAQPGHEGKSGRGDTPQKPQNQSASRTSGSDDLQSLCFAALFSQKHAEALVQQLVEANHAGSNGGVDIPNLFSPAPLVPDVAAA